MGIYKLWSKKITHDYPWVKKEAVSLYMLWPSSDYLATSYVASGYVETEAQYKSKSMKPISFYINQET